MITDETVTGLLPVPQPVPASCGNRLDVPRWARRHLMVDLGPDVRNGGAVGFRERNIKVCVRCGTEREEGLAL